MRAATVARRWNLFLPMCVNCHNNEHLIKVAYIALEKENKIFLRVDYCRNKKVFMLCWWNFIKRNTLFSFVYYIKIQKKDVLNNNKITAISIVSFNVKSKWFTTTEQSNYKFFIYNLTIMFLYINYSESIRPKQLFYCCVRAFYSQKKKKNTILTQQTHPVLFSIRRIQNVYNNMHIIIKKKHSYRFA